MTKKEAIERKANWSKALAEGRVIRYNFGQTLRSYHTAEEARLEVERFKDAGHHALIVVVTQSMGIKSNENDREGC